MVTISTPLVHPAEIRNPRNQSITRINQCPGQGNSLVAGLDEYLHGEPAETRQKGRTPDQGCYPNTERLCRGTGNDGSGG